MLDRGCLCDQPPTKTLGTESLVSFLGRQHFTCVITIHYWGIKHVLYDSTKRESVEAYTWFPLDFAQVASTFAYVA